MSTWLERLGRTSARRRGRVVAAWAILAVIIGFGNAVWGGATIDDPSVPGVESQRAADLLAERFPDRSGATAMVVFHSAQGRLDQGATTEAIDDTLTRVRELDHVRGATGPTSASTSADGRTSFAMVQYDRPTADLDPSALDGLEATAEPARKAGVQVEYGGELPTAFKVEDTGFGELIGIAAALTILFVMFRSLLAAAMPPLLAAAGLLIGLSLVGILGNFIDIPTVAPRLGMMIGLGVGIDYALFVLSRHRDNLGDGMDVEESIARTNATAGQAVVVAGGTVVVAILGLRMSGIPFVAALGYSASIVVALAVLVAITLLPALLGFLGNRLQPHPHRRIHRKATTAPQSGWLRWAKWVAHHPWPSAITATIAIVVLALPTFGLHLGQPDAGTDPVSTTQRQAYDLIADGFGEGFNGPLLVVVDQTNTTDRDVASLLAAAVRKNRAVDAVAPPVIDTAGDTALISVIPKTRPQAPETSALVHELRDTTIPDTLAGTDATAYVGGPTARFIDQADRVGQRLGWFIGAVVALSFLLLMSVFRSILVPLKAALLNLLSIGAAYGIVVAVFQWGWGLSLVRLADPVPIAAFVPMMMFAILFGLSMDYEVFILSRISEEYRSGHPNIDSVVVGLGATAKVITAAALIMISVFLGFVTSGDPMVKMMGVGLAAAVAVDATVVRMVLVPATMALVGDVNWWLPKWLDRLLPRIEIEGPTVGTGQTVSSGAIAAQTASAVRMQLVASSPTSPSPSEPLSDSPQS